MPRSTPINDPKDFPRFVKWTQYIGAAFIVYGFCWFLFGGHHYAFIGGKDYAEVGLMSLGIAYILGGALLVGIYGRWLYVENDNDKERAVFFTYTMSLPVLALAIWFNVYVFKCLSIIDSYSVIKVKATEPVKEELKWLLGDLYPEEQEVNIDPESLEWEFKTSAATSDIQDHFLVAHSPQATVRQREHYNHQLNEQHFEVEWLEGYEKRKRVLELDWNAAVLASYLENKSDPKSFPSCELRVPVKNYEPVDSDHLILVNGEDPTVKGGKKYLFDTDVAVFKRPTKSLPPILRLSESDLVIRTNYMGQWWSAYCGINFPNQNRKYQAEPITRLSLSNLNWAKYQLHFHLFNNLRENVLHFKIDRYRRRATFDEFFEQLNKIVALDILGTQIRGNMVFPSY